MEKQQAKNLIQETFENSFDKGRFTRFSKNLLNHIEEAPFTYQGQYIPEAYRQYISTLERIGKFNDGENRIDILIIKLQKATSLERARTMQRNFVAWYLNGSRGGEMKDGALVAFVSPDEEDWRFSLVKMDYKFEQTKTGRMKVKEEFTPARRWSFLVGANEKSHTAQSRLVNILANDQQAPTLAELEKSFDIETVTKEFFIKYRELFIRTKEALDSLVRNDAKISTNFKAKGVNTVDFAKKLLGQIIFLYFLQKKGWFGVGRDADWGTGCKHFLRELFEKKHADYKNFFNDILEPLFYEALRVGEERKQDDYYYSRFNCKIPFLNGGLFDPIGNYDWVHTDINIPDSLFSNAVKTKEGDTGDGILDVFDRYNFTVKEDEPLEKEVAIDPELLGKAYEKFNAIRPDNFEEYKKALKTGKAGEESKFNKQYGVYYTPREIVHYMCQQSLINYLFTELNSSNISYEKLGDSNLNLFGNEGDRGQLALTIEHRKGPEILKEDIETLIHCGEQISENEEIALIKEQKINEGKQKTSDYKLKLPESIRKNAQLIDEKLADITVCDPAVGSGAFPVGMMSEIVKVRNVLSTFIPPPLSPLEKGGIKGGTRTTYDFKRQCIEHSLYGVDIDPGAVEIAKLRLWLSLVVDEDDIKDIKPLPNLDYKVVCGNSLLGVEKNLFNVQLFSELEKLKPLYFNETNPTKKQDYKKQIDGLISQITNGHKEFDFEIYFSEIFHQKSGFDVVIANPPYVKEDVNRHAFEELRNSECYQGKMDLWYLFGCRGLDVLKSNGVMCFIATNNWISNDGASKFRDKVIAQGKIVDFIDFGGYKIFSAGIQTMVFILAKTDQPTKYRLNYGRLVNEQASVEILADFLDRKGEFTNGHYTKFPVSFDRSEYVGKYINFIPSTIGKILDKIKSNANFYLGDDEIFSGIDVMQDFVTKQHLEKLDNSFSVGDGVFVLSNSEKKSVKWNKKELHLLKPYYTTREIQRYYANTKNRFWILYTGGEVNAKIAEYPNIKKHLDRFQPIITSVNKPYGLHRTRDEAIFLGEKILATRKCARPIFSFVDFPCYISRTFLIIKSKRINLKYLLSILNSSLIAYWLFHKGKLQGNQYQVDKVPLMAIPILNAAKDEQLVLIQLVDKILDITKDDEYLESPAKQAEVREYEKQIDQLVYKFYGLTPEEIKIVEGKNGNTQ